MQYYDDWAPYVSVAQRRLQALKQMNALRKKGVNIRPVEIQGLKIAKKFWGKAWCDHIESFNDYENRLPRGRTYVRNGSVCHLAITKGTVKAKVMGSDLYDIEIKIETLSAKQWKAIKQRCSGQIGSLLELLQGKLSDNVMQEVTDSEQGLFPLADEISLDCDCPDWADLCKHLAAVLYGVGARLDEDPALLFLLRGVDHEELIDVDAQLALQTTKQSSKTKRIATGDLGDVFGIDIAADEPKASSKTKMKRKAKTTTLKKKPTPTKKTSSKKKSTAAKKKKVVSKKATKKAVGKAKKSSVTKKTATPKRPTAKKKTVKPAKKQATPKKKVAKKSSKKVAQKPAAKKKKKVTRKSKTTNQTVTKKSTPKKKVKKTTSIKKNVVKKAAIRKKSRKRS